MLNDKLQSLETSMKNMGGLIRKEPRQMLHILS